LTTKITTFSKDFKSLIEGMLHADPSKRPTIEDVKKSKFYKGAVYSQSVYLSKMSGLLSSE